MCLEDAGEVGLNHGDCFCAKESAGTRDFRESDTDAKKYLSDGPLVSNGGTAKRAPFTDGVHCTIPINARLVAWSGFIENVYRL